MSPLTHPMRTAGRGLLAATLGIALVVPNTALASGDIWAECGQTDAVSTNHTQKEFSEALRNPPADAAEYSNCTELIKAAQAKAASGGNTSSGSGTTPSAPGASGGTGGTGGTAPQAVAPADLSQALADSGIDPVAPAGSVTAAPAPSVVGGEKIDLSSDRLPSIANALSLPLPLAASAVVVMFSAALPVVRFGVARFGAPPTGSTPQL